MFLSSEGMRGRVVNEKEMPFKSQDNMAAVWECRETAHVGNDNGTKVCHSLL